MYFASTGKPTRQPTAGQQARLDLEDALGPMHPDVATVIMNQAVLEWQRSEISKAVDLAEEATARREHTTGVMLRSGSEEQKLEFARTLARETATVVSIAASAPDDPAARSLAFKTVLARKGRALDEGIRGSCERPGARRTPSRSRA